MSASIPPARLRVVIDTNEVVSAYIVRTSLPARLLNAWRNGRFVLVTSTNLVKEIANVLSRPAILDRYGLRQTEISELVTRMSQSFTAPLPLAALPIHCRDPKDDQFLAAALGGNAGYIVSGDRDLLSLDGHPALGALRIVTVRTFLDLFG